VNSATTDQTLRAELRQAGLRATAPRVAVLRLLRRARLPLSHPEVVAALDSNGWDRVTLYRNLVDLASRGLARRTDLGDRVWRFAATGRAAAHAHPHFVCRDCGGVFCLTDVRIDLSPGPTAPAALRADQYEVQLAGLCDRCRQEDR